MPPLEVEKCGGRLWPSLFRKILPLENRRKRKGNLPKVEGLRYFALAILKKIDFLLSAFRLLGGRRKEEIIIVYPIWLALLARNVTAFSRRPVKSETNKDLTRFAWSAEVLRTSLGQPALREGQDESHFGDSFLGK